MKQDAYREAERCACAYMMALNNADNYFSKKIKDYGRALFWHNRAKEHLRRLLSINHNGAISCQLSMLRKKGYFDEERALWQLSGGVM